MMILVPRVLNIDHFNAFLNLHLKVLLATSHAQARTHIHTHTDGVSDSLPARPQSTFRFMKVINKIKIHSYFHLYFISTNPETCSKHVFVSGDTGGVRCNVKYNAQLQHVTCKLHCVHFTKLARDYLVTALPAL
jgi:hypothetical protein